MCQTSSAWITYDTRSAAASGAQKDELSYGRAYVGTVKKTNENRMRIDVGSNGWLKSHKNASSISWISIMITLSTSRSEFHQKLIIDQLRAKKSSNMRTDRAVKRENNAPLPLENCFQIQLAQWHIC